MVDSKLVKDAVVEISKRAANYEYFFDQLTSPDWIEPLREEEFFTSPPQPKQEEEWISFPFWPESRYLARVADKAPDLVLKVILDVPETDNVRVHEDFAEAALNMPVQEAARVAMKEAKWTAKQAFLYGLYAHKLAEVIRHLARGGETEAALRLTRILFALESADGDVSEGIESALREPRAKMRSWDYGEALRIILPNLFPIAGISGLEILSALLEVAAGRPPEDRPFDGSYVWRPAIEEHDQNFNRDSLRDYLTVAVRDAALSLAASDETQLPLVIRTLEERQWHVFRRVALHVVLNTESASQQIIIDRLLNQSNLSDVGIHHEFWVFARDKVGVMPDEVRSQFFDLIRAGPDIQDLQSSRQERGDNAMTPEEVDSYLEHWKRTRLTILREHLPPDLESERAKLVDKYGDPEHPEFQMYMSGLRTGPNSPVDRRQLEQMEIGDLVGYLRTWEPPDEWMGPSRAGLGQDLSALAAEHPTPYADNAERFRDVHPTFVRSLLSGMREAAKKEQPFDWNPVINLCRWVVDQSFEPDEEFDSDEDRGWRWTRKAVADLLSAGLDSGPCEIAFDLREGVWQTLSLLIDDPDPTPQHEARYGGTNMDSATLSLNTTRGEAMHTLIRYGLWVRRHGQTAESDQRSFEEMPEVRQALERHLEPQVDPSLAVRSVYGQWFPWIALLDREWTSQHVAHIFPSDEVLSDFRDAAWDTYIVFCQPFDTPFLLLRGQYLSAIDRIGDRSDKQRRFDDPDRGLAHHLMTFYWQGKLDIEEEGGLLQHFFSKAPRSLKGDAIDFIGRSLSNTTGPTNTKILERLARLWEWRLELARAGELAEFEEELGAFAWWFHSEKFDESWAVARMKEALSLRPKVEGAHLVAKTLVSLAESRPEDAIEILSLLVGVSHKDWGILGWKDEARAVIEKVISGEDPLAKGKAIELVHELGSRGHREFRDLLIASQEQEGP